MGEVRIVSPGKTLGYPYPVCKKSLDAEVCGYTFWGDLSALEVFVPLREALVAVGNKVEGEVRDIVSIQAQTSPYFQLREKKCIEHIDICETELKTSLKPENLNKTSPNFRYLG